MRRLQLYTIIAAIVLVDSGTAAWSENDSVPLVYAALSGAWVGALEYRDYTTNQRVLLPTILDIRKTREGDSLVFHYIYDDGPTKVVDDSETVTVNAKDNTYVTVSTNPDQTDLDKVTGLSQFGDGGQLVRLGRGTENDAPVDVRTTITISSNRLTMLKETRITGKPFEFRDEYTLTRVSSVVTGK